MRKLDAAGRQGAVGHLRFSGRTRSSPTSRWACTPCTLQATSNLPHTPVGMNTINPAAAAARENARAANGQFGNQQHSAPEPAEGTSWTPTSLAQYMARALHRFESLQREAQARFPNGKVSLILRLKTEDSAAEPAASVTQATGNYLVQAVTTADGRQQVSVNGEPFDAAVHGSMRVANQLARDAQTHRELLANLADAQSRRCDAEQLVWDHSLYRVVTPDGKVQERHYSKRGAELAAECRHPDAVVEPPQLDEAEYLAELQRLQESQR